MYYCAMEDDAPNAANTVATAAGCNRLFRKQLSQRQAVGATLLEDVDEQNPLIKLYLSTSSSSVAPTACDNWSPNSWAKPAALAIAFIASKPSSSVANDTVAVA